MPEPTDFDLLAASLRADARDVDGFVEALATKLEASFPEQTRIERKGGRLGGARKHVRRVELEIGERRYELSHRSGSVGCMRRTVVRGIALKSEELTLDAWIDALSGDLLGEADRSERSRLALERLLTS